MNCTAIILAGGSGQRFGPEKPKQYQKLLGRTLLEHSVLAFESVESVDSIIVVVAPELTAEVAELLFASGEFSKLNDVIAGGATRSESTINALRFIEETVELVAIHDAARPVIHVDDIVRVIISASEAKAALLVSSVTDTIKRVEKSLVKETVSRAELYRAETPQVFERELIIRAHESAVSSGSIPTDDSQAVEALGEPVKTVVAEHPNIKVTTQADLTLAEAILRSRNKK